MFPVTLKDPVSGKSASVSNSGQLVIGLIRYDETEFRELGEPDTAYNFYKPVPSWQFVITGIVAKADKQVSSTVDAVVVIYESSSNNSIITDKVLYQTAMVEGDSIVILPLNIISSEGVYINAKTSDDDIHITIMGYRVPV